jgi:sugar phosphate isomerase/epimerase
MMLPGTASRLSRRELLGAGLASAAAWVDSRPATATVKPRGFDGFRGVEMAICTDGFGNRRHEPAFRVIPELGFRNVEFNLWYADTITPAYIRSLRERCARTGLRPISLQGTGFGGVGRDGIIKDVAHKLLLMQFIRGLGGRIVKFTGAKRDTQGGLPEVIEVCRELAPAAEELGVLVVLENHAGNVLERIEDYEQIFAAIDSPNIGLCLDTGHFEGVNVDLHEVLDKLGSRTLHVDLKDCRARGEGHHTVPFGEGVTDFDGFLTHLRETGYRGYLVVEQAWAEPQGDWVANLKSAYARFRKWEQPAG